MQFGPKIYGAVQCDYITIYIVFFSRFLDVAISITSSRSHLIRNSDDFAFLQNHSILSRSLLKSILYCKVQLFHTNLLTAVLGEIKVDKIPRSCKQSLQT